MGDPGIDFVIQLNTVNENDSPHMHMLLPVKGDRCAVVMIDMI